MSSNDNRRLQVFPYKCLSDGRMISHERDEVPRDFNVASSHSPPSSLCLWCNHYTKTACKSTLSLLFIQVINFFVQITYRLFIFQVVILGEHKGDKTTPEIKDHHLSFLYSVKASKQEAEVSLIYSYSKSLNGFSALLTADEAAKLSRKQALLSQEYF